MDKDQRYEEALDSLQYTAQELWRKEEALKAARRELAELKQQAAAAEAATVAAWDSHSEAICDALGTYYEDKPTTMRDAFGHHHELASSGFDYDAMIRGIGTLHGEVEQLTEQLAELRAEQEVAVAAALNEQAKAWCRAAEHAGQPLLEQLLGLVPLGADLTAGEDIRSGWSVRWELYTEDEDERGDFVLGTSRDESLPAALRAATLELLRCQPASARQCQTCQHWDLTAEPLAGARPCTADPDRIPRHPAASCDQPGCQYVPRCETDTEPAPSSGERPADASERVIRAAVAWAGDPLTKQSHLLQTERALLEAVMALQVGEGGES